MEEKSEEEDDAGEVEVEFFSGKERMKGEEYRDDEQRVEDRLRDVECSVEEKGGVDERNQENDELRNESGKSAGDEDGRDEWGEREEGDDVLEKGIEIDPGRLVEEVGEG